MLNLHAFATRRRFFPLKAIACAWPEKSGIHGRRYRHGHEGLWKAETGKYDLIILDIMLPTMDRLEILTALRAKKIHTHVLFLTARDSVDDRVRGLRNRSHRTSGESDPALWVNQRCRLITDVHWYEIYVS
jgi:CheY-like chemotaxis protein